MIKQLLAIVFFASAAFFCDAQAPLYRIMQHAGNADRYYSICFDPNKHLWAGGRPNGLRLNRTDVNLEIKSILGLDPEPGIEYYISEIGWDAGNRLIGCGNYQDGNFGKGFIVRFDPLAFPNELLFLKKIEGDSVRLSGLIQSPADSTLLVYGTSRVGGVQRGELFKFDRSTGALRPGFPQRYSVGQGLSLDAAILHAGRLYTAGACSLGGALGGNSTTFGLTCLDATSGEPLWFSSNPAPAGQTMHLEARDLIFTNDDGDALVMVGSGDDQHSPAQGSHIFLQKSRLDGSLLWIKKIDLPDWTGEFAEEVVAVSDGYLIYGRSSDPAQTGVFLLKTDENGQSKWARKISRGTATTLPDWPAQSQMLVGNEAIYLTCNAAVTTSLGSRVALLVKLQLDGTLANCPNVQPTPVVNLPFNNLSSIVLGLSATASPLQVTTITAPVQTNSAQSLGSGAYCTQTGYICNDRPDLTAHVDSTYCSTTVGGLGAAVRFCNKGKTANPTGFYVSFYDSNPLTGPAKRLLTHRLQYILAPNECRVVNLPLATVFPNHTRVYTLVGADSTVQTPIALGSFPLPGGFLECVYTNNLDSFDLNLPPDCFPDPCQSNTFLKILGKTTDFQNLSCFRASGDGNLYMAGHQNGRTLLCKMEPDGNFLWARSFSIAPLQNPALAEIIVDSEGMIVGAGRQGSTAKGFVFRYNPATDQMLWVQLFDSDRPAEGGILEKEPGGNFLLYQSPKLPEFLVQNGEVLELNRTTGQIMPGFARRYKHGYSEAIACMVAHNGALYATGFADSVVGNELARRMILMKLDPHTGDVIWSRTGHTDWQQPSYFRGFDLLVDSNSLLTMYYGSEETYRIHQGDGIPTYTFLQKSNLNGEVLWVKRYPFGIFPKELIAVPDGYVISGGFFGRYFFKTDKNGNLLNSKQLTTSTGGNNSNAEEQNQMERIGAYVFIADYETTQGGTRQHTVLLKTGLDLELEFPCTQYISVPAQDSTTATLPKNYPAQQILSASPATQQVIATTMTGDEVLARETCPTCLSTVCTDKPDINLRVDSLTCLSAGAYAASISVCNLGKVAPDTGFYLTFYDKNPLVGSAAVLQSVFLAEKPKPGSCMQATVPLDAALLKHPQIFTLVGVGANVPTPVFLSGFPFSGGFAECEYANNLDSFVVKKPDCNGGNDCADAETFLKKLGSRLDVDLVFSMCKTADGNFYLAGRKNPIDHFIAKMTPGGDVIWMRKIPAGTNGSNSRISEIIEDSDGKIAFCATQGTTPNARTVFAMRYDPVGDTLIWFKYFGATRPAAVGIVEKGPGGNFLVTTYAQVISTGRIYAQIFELGRNTGETVTGAITSRYEGSSLVRFERMVARQNSLYATGARQQNNGEPTRSILAKLSASTGNVEWVQATTPDSTSSTQPDVLHTDLEFDGDFALMVGSGLRDAADPAQGIFAYLEKHAPDGSLLWLKRYEVSIYPEDVLVLPNAYVIVGKMADNRWALLKTDKDGNPLIFKTLNTSSAPLNNTLLANRQGLILDTGDRLFMADYGPMTDDPSAVWLLKTSHDLELDVACGLLQPASVQATTMPAKSALVPLTRTPFTFSTADAGVIYEKDSLRICGLCPVCPCCAPDLTARVDSISCSSFDGIVANVSVCNLGEMSPDTGFYLTFYDKNPLVGSAAVLQSVFLAEKPKPGSCVQATVPLDAALLKHPQIFTLVGVGANVPTPVSLSGFPFADGFGECEYANNLDSFEVQLPAPQKLDLGPDRFICTGQTVTLDAGSGYVLYNWSTGPNTQTYTTDATGSFAVEVIDACGRKQRDTVQVTVLPYPKRTVYIVLLPGDSVLIGGKTYKGATTFVDTIPSLSGPCDTVTTYHIRLDSLHCTGKAEAFIQANYFKSDHSKNEHFIGRVVLPASDGSIYTGGENDLLDWQFVLTKTAANGKVLWSRGFDFANSTQNATIIDHLIEDSEGKLVGTFTQLASTGGKVHFTIFRYDPQSDQVLWVKNVRTPEAVSTPRILAEAKVGGNFIVAYSLASTPQGSFSEVCELDRATGNPVGNSARRYGPGVTFYGGTVHKGILYANGLVRDTTTSSIAVKNGYVKIDLSTGQPIDQKILKTVSGSGVVGQAAVVGQDEYWVSLLFSADTAIWLRKTTLNGDVLWLKRYKITGLPLASVNTVGISAVSDGYVFALEFFDANSHYIGSGLLKADPNGNMVWAKQFDALGVFWGRSPQIVEARGDHIYLTGAMDVPLQTSAKTSGTLVAKLDKDGNVGQDCGFFKNISVSASDQANTYERAVVHVTKVGRSSENVPSGPRTDYDLDIYTRCSRCFDPCAIALALPPYLSLCPGDTLMLQAPEDFDQFTWQDGSTGRSLVVTQPGLYHVMVKDKCGLEQRDSVTVSWATPPVVQKIVVLLPGESIFIAGKTYSAPAKFEVIIPSKTGICDTIAQYSVVVSPSGCQRPRAFLKSFDGAQSLVIAADKNNGAYLLGESQGATTLARFDSTGQLLWVREIIKNLGGSGHSLIQDSDGMLTGCVSHSNGGQAVAFRYDPTAQQMLWLRILELDANFTTDAPHDILEEKPGGHFLLLAEHSEMSIGTPFFKSEILRLDRTTGALIGPAHRYGLSRFREAVVYGNALYISGTLQDPSVADNNSGGLLKIDLTTDQVLWAKRMTLLWPNSYGGEDLLLDADGNIVSLLTRINEFVLQKNSPDGSLIWQRKYTVDFPGMGGVFGYNIRLLPDGDYTVALAGNFNIGSSILIARVAKDGPVKWAKIAKNLVVFGSPGTQWLDVRENTIYFTHGATEPYSTLFGKFDASGDISGACQLADDIQINYASSFIGQIPATLPVDSRTKTLFSPSTTAPVVLDYKSKFRCIQCESICDTIRVTKTIPFYPGDTIVIDGVAYMQSDTVVQTFTTPAGCDSVVTNILKLVLTEVKITCPNNLTVTLPPNQTTTVVDYNLPTANTDCPDPAITFKLLQGPAVGGSFPQGITQVCYEAANRCGVRDTCCFAITALPPDPPCDVKIPTGCIRYELLNIRLDALGQPRYRVRLTNTCASPLEFAYIQLPNGVLAVSPKEGTTYTAPGSNTYAVRNPNASPFYSVRYKAVAGSLNNGKNDVFEYTLPQQSAPAYIRVAAKLADGTASEAFLNTYNCPVLPYTGTENLEFRKENAVMPPRTPFSILNAPLLVRPNPTSGALFVDLGHWRLDSKSNLQSNTPIHLRVLNAQGQLVLERDCVIGAEEMRLDLPAGLASGLYYLVVQPEGGERAAVRFVLER